MIQIDVFVVQDKETMKVVEVFAVESEFNAWWAKQDTPHDHYYVIYRENVASVKQVLATV